jgi:lipopolysaccharide/colanic/teichoic acid biosynthesis glycosyltransferase
MSLKLFGRFQENMYDEALGSYRAHLAKRRVGLAAKRCFDIVVSLLCIIVPLPLYIIAAAAIKLDSRGPVFYRQLRVGCNCNELNVLKFRTMRTGADKEGEITVGSTDGRITPVGRVLRAANFDEFPQFLQVLAGKMSLIGVRPEVPHYVQHYAKEDYATLLMRPGMTSPVAIKYRHESEMLACSADPERTYIEEILPAKMALNRTYVAEFSFFNDMRILGRTFKCLFEKDEAVGEKQKITER